MTIKLKDSDKIDGVLALASGTISSGRNRASMTILPAMATVGPESRFSGHRVFTLTSSNGMEFRTLETWERPNVPPPGSRGERYFFVDGGYAYRSDLIAYAVFGTPRYDWWILISNDMYDNLQLRTGTTIRIVPPPAQSAETTVRRPF